VALGTATSVAGRASAAPPATAPSIRQIHKTGTAVYTPTPTGSGALAPLSTEIRGLSDRRRKGLSARLPTARSTRTAASRPGPARSTSTSVGSSEAATAPGPRWPTGTPGSAGSGLSGRKRRRAAGRPTVRGGKPCCTPVSARRVRFSVSAQVGRTPRPRWCSAGGRLGCGC
jgi:hypothetical protein